MSEEKKKPGLSGRDSVKIVLNSPVIAKLMAHEDIYKILEKKGQRIETALRKKFKKVEVRRATARDGRAAVLYVVHDMTKSDFKYAAVQKALLNAKIRPAKKR
jgi:hypothetical protein